jgi:hypothetical protein
MRKDLPVDTVRYEMIRESVLAALDEMYCPLLQPEVQALVLARDGLDISIGEIEQVVGLEEKTFDAGKERDTWLCPALEPPDFYPDTDYVTRSDWSAHNRMVNFGMEPERRTWLLRGVSDQVAILLENRRDPAPLATVFQDLVRQFPAEALANRLGVPPGQPINVEIHDERQVETVREVAEDEHAILAKDEYRQQQAVKAVDLPLRERLFGVAD